MHAVFLGNTLFNAASSTGDSGGNMSAGSESGGSNPIDGLKTVFENPNATKILTWVARSISSASGFFLSFILTKVRTPQEPNFCCTIASPWWLPLLPVLQFVW